MNKTDLVNSVSDQAELSRASAAAAVDAVLEAIKTELMQGGTVSLIGFGAFSIRERAARTGRDPRTGKALNIKASKNPVFKAGKALKDAVN